MSRGKQDKLYRSFNKGLITEAGFLTYPEDASIDELNTVIYRKGNRSRRPGIDYETGSTAVSFSGDTPSLTSISAEYFWRSPGNKPALNFLVIQVGATLYFFDATVSPLSSGLKTFTVNLLDFIAPTATSALVKANRVQMVGGKGNLFVAQEYIDPFTIVYNSATDTISTIRIIIQIRDFDGVNDELSNDTEPATLSVPHHYNLLNQGWVTPGTATTPTTGGSSPGTSGEYYNPWTGEKYPPEEPIID
jgi:hypothetical protein